MNDKKVVLFPFDYEEYIANSKSLAFNFDQYTPGVRAYNFKDLLYMMENNINLDVPSKDEILKVFWGENYLEKASNDFLYCKIKQL